MCVHVILKKKKNSIKKTEKFSLVSGCFFSSSFDSGF
jgi:hypothetical protein